ncbi:MAG: MmcQ/YjbR family DNA-binding protein [Chloroflexota bacterium]
MTIDQIRAYVLSLPETTEEPHFDKISFRIRGKILVTVPPDKAHAHIFVDDEHLEMAVNVYADFAEVLMWGKRPSAVRIRLADVQEEADRRAVEGLILNAWQRKAPKRLVKAFNGNANT